MNAPNLQIKKDLTVVAITQEECCVWKDGLAPNTAPLRVHPKVFVGKKQFHNVHEDQTHRGHDADKFGKEFLEAISLVLADTRRFLLITHGSGKSNAYAAFTEHLDSHHSRLAERLAGHIEVDLTSMTDPQILALARGWDETHISKNS